MIALITPTGARPTQIMLCARYMHRQTYAGDVLWVIVDDGPVSTTDFITQNSFKENWEIIKIYPEQKWKEGDNTQARNLQLAINAIKQRNDVDAVFIIEDDDWYCRDYLQIMCAGLQKFEFMGDTRTKYFNIRDFSLLQNRNVNHASLFQLAFQVHLLPLLEQTLSSNQKYIDIEFCKLCKSSNVKMNLFSCSQVLSVGIKGMAGRSGIGSGHKPVQALQKVTIQHTDRLKVLIGMDYLNYL